MTPHTVFCFAVIIMSVIGSVLLLDLPVSTPEITPGILDAHCTRSWSLFTGDRIPYITWLEICSGGYYP